MKPIEFDQQNAVFAKNQPPYLPLPAYIVDEPEGRVISCWKLSWRERIKILFGYPLWLSQMAFGKPLQPQKPSLDNPFTAH
jgi:hypothetical protein